MHSFRTDGEAIVLSPRRRRHSGVTTQKVGLVYIAPPLALFVFGILVPLGYGAYISLWRWDGITQATFVGFDNYLDAVTDPLVLQAFAHSFFLVAFYSAIPICLGLVLTGVIARYPLRFTGTWRVLLFLPQVLSIVVVGVAWQWLLAADGPVNQLLRLVGLGGLTRVWLGDFVWALPAQGAIGAWLMSGLCMVLFLSAAQNIDHELYDAAAVDGAGPVREFFAVTVPSLRRVIVVAAVLTFTVSLNNFGLIWVTTRGGPGGATQVVATLVYERAFVVTQLGSASALALLLGLIVMAISLGITRISRED
ncbi:sugar ABC transporter permease [Microbacterium lacus]|uniref:Sugar ABC transporter permease n=1 Tax=Microbacterium lacus TaxID=415217 RepID=A0ABP4RTY8_9MICO